MKKILSVLLAAAILLSLAACKQHDEVVPDTTQPTTEAAEDGLEHYDLNEIDLEGIGELLADRDISAVSRIRLDGLCTPVVLELTGTDLTQISTYGTTVSVSQEASDYASIFGNVSPHIYQHDGMIFLNIWQDDLGYSCVIFPDGTYRESFPDNEYSIMIYLDEEEQMCQSQFARKFMNIEQWDTGPIDTAVSRDDFYYSIDDASWTPEDGYTTTARESYTISDRFELDEIFNQAKDAGLYPEFDNLDELLEYNDQRFKEAEDENSNSGPDSVEEKIGFFDQHYLTKLYDSQHNLICETFYDTYGEAYFTKTHNYNDQDQEISGSWSFQGEEIYRYTNAYSKSGLTTETVWYQGDQEIERFAYTYNSKGGYTKTFFQNGQKQYTYTFDESGELIGHSTYKDGKEIKTQDVSILVKTPLLTDVFLPSIDDNLPMHYEHRYRGTTPCQVSGDAETITASDGSYTMIWGYEDAEDDTGYRQEAHYDADGRILREIHTADGAEYQRDEYQYDSSGLCTGMITYLEGELDMTCTNEYNQAGQLIRKHEVYTTEQSYITFLDKDGSEVEQENTYMTRTETYRYDDHGMLAETVLYEDDKETYRIGYDYDTSGYILPRLDTYRYVYNVEGLLEGIWLIYEDSAAGMVLLRNRIVYVTPENARQLQEILRSELTWF